MRRRLLLNGEYWGYAVLELIAGSYVDTTHHWYYYYSTLGTYLTSTTTNTATLEEGCELYYTHGIYRGVRHILTTQPNGTTSTGSYTAYLYQIDATWNTRIACYVIDKDGNKYIADDLGDSFEANNTETITNVLSSCSYNENYGYFNVVMNQTLTAYSGYTYTPYSGTQSATFMPTSFNSGEITIPKKALWYVVENVTRLYPYPSTNTASYSEVSLENNENDSIDLDISEPVEIKLNKVNLYV